MPAISGAGYQQRCPAFSKILECVDSGCILRGRGTRRAPLVLSQSWLSALLQLLAALPVVEQCWVPIECGKIQFCKERGRDVRKQEI